MADFCSLVALGGLFWNLPLASCHAIWFTAECGYEITSSTASLGTMSAYPWTCKVCGGTNEANVSLCSACRFPACASLAEIVAARASGVSLSSPFVPPSPEPNIPLPRKLLVWLVVGLILVGAVLAKFAPPVWLNLVGLAIAGLGLLVGWAVGAFRKEPRV